MNDLRDIDRPDSPDFLTADEDDRTTAVASDLQDDQAESVEGSGGSGGPSSNCSTTTQGSHLSTVVEVSQERAETSPKPATSKKTPLPDPPTDTKPFMEVPLEAFLADQFLVQRQTTEACESEESESSQAKDETTWSSNAQGAQNVVCEQPSSTQVSYKC